MTTPLTVDEVERWMDGYHLRPRPDLVPAALAALRASGHLGDERTAAPVAAFLSQLLREDPEPAGAWLGEVRTDVERAAVVEALWLTDTEQARELLSAMTPPVGGDLQELIAALLAEHPPDLLAVPVEDGAVLDVLWAAYMASGDARYVLRVISVLPDGGPVGEAARWSLASNAVRLDGVREICVRALDHEPDDVAAILRTILEADPPTP
jgi:hypothetical protein